MEKSRPYNNIQMDVPRFAKAKTVKHSYDYGSLLGALDKIAFDVVEIPLYAYRNILRNNDDIRGNQLVGYIEGYDEESDKFTVVIYEKFADTIEDFDMPVIFPRVKVDHGFVTKILGFDICPQSYYRLIR